MVDPSTGPVHIPPSDGDLLAQCRVDTFRSGGKGGQHQNTTDSGVRLTHLPTGIVATARRARSQHRNRAIALARLRERLEALNRKAPERVPTKIPARERRRRLEEKRQRSQAKRLRRKPEPGEDG